MVNTTYSENLIKGLIMPTTGTKDKQIGGFPGLFFVRWAAAMKAKGLPVPISDADLGYPYPLAINKKTGEVYFSPSGVPRTRANDGLKNLVMGAKNTFIAQMTADAEAVERANAAAVKVQYERMDKAAKPLAEADTVALTKAIEARAKAEAEAAAAEKVKAEAEAKAKKDAEAVVVKPVAKTPAPKTPKAVKPVKAVKEAEAIVAAASIPADIVPVPEPVPVA